MAGGRPGAPTLRRRLPADRRPAASGTGWAEVDPPKDPGLRPRRRRTSGLPRSALRTESCPRPAPGPADPHSRARATTATSAEATPSSSGPTIARSSVPEALRARPPTAGSILPRRVSRHFEIGVSALDGQTCSLQRGRRLLRRDSCRISTHAKFKLPDNAMSDELEEITSDIDHVIAGHKSGTAALSAHPRASLP